MPVTRKKTSEELFKFLANSFKAAINQQTAALVQAIEKSSELENPLQAIIYGAFDEVGASITRDFSSGMMSQVQKTMGLSLEQFGADLGHGFGNILYASIVEPVTMARNVIKDFGSNPLIHVEEAVSNMSKQIGSAIAEDIPKSFRNSYKAMRDSRREASVVGSMSEESPHIVPYIKMLNKQIKKYNDRNPDNQRPYIDPSQSRHLGSGVMAHAIYQPTEDGGTVYKASRVQNSKITKPFDRILKKYGISIANPDEIQAMQQAEPSGVTPKLRSYGDRFIEMEFFRGVTIKKALQGMDQEIAKQLIIEIGQALSAIHKTGTAHNDFHWENILLTEQGIKAIDFGLAIPNATSKQKDVDFNRILQDLDKFIQENHPNSGIDTRALLAQGYATTEPYVPGIATTQAARQRLGSTTPVSSEFTPAQLQRYTSEVEAQFARAEEIKQVKSNFRTRSQQPPVASVPPPEPSVITEEIPQLIRAYQQEILEEIRNGLKAQMSSIKATLQSLLEMPLDTGDELQTQREDINAAIVSRSRDILGVFNKALESLYGVGTGDNTSLEQFEQLKADFQAILIDLETSASEKVENLIHTLQQISEAYKSEAPPLVAGATSNPHTERFEGIIHDEINHLQSSLAKLFEDVTKATGANFNELRGVRARLGLPPVRQGQLPGTSPATPQLSAVPVPPPVPLITRYGDYLKRKVKAAQASGREKIAGLIPDLEGMTKQQRSEALGKLKEQATAELKQVRDAVTGGNLGEARRIGEALIQRIQAIRATYDDLSASYQGDKRAFNGVKGSLTRMSTELEARLKYIAENATGTLVDEIERDLGNIEQAGEHIGDALTKGTEDSLGIQSPSRVFRKIGEQIIAGFREGVSRISKVTEYIKDELVLLDVKHEPSKKARQIGEQITGGLSAGVSGVKGVIDSLKDRFALLSLKYNLPFFNNTPVIGDDTGKKDEGENSSQNENPVQEVINIADEKSAEGIRNIRENIFKVIDSIPLLGQVGRVIGGIGMNIGIAGIAFAGLFSVGKTAGLDIFIEKLSTLSDKLPEAGREVESLRIAFQSVSGSGNAAGKAMEYVGNIADKFGVNIRSAEQAYLGLVAATKGTELEGLQTNKIFEAFSQTASLRGLNDQQQQQMFVAVQQILGKGKLSAEEVRGQLGEIPALAFQQTLAESMGVSLQQLDKLMKSGELGSETIFKVAQQYASANAKIGEGVNTAQTALAKLENAGIKMQRALGAVTLNIQKSGFSIFGNILDFIASKAELLVNILTSGVVVAIITTIVKFVNWKSAMEIIVTAIMAVDKALVGALLASLGKLVLQMAAVNLVINVFSEAWKQINITEGEKGIESLSKAYEKLGGSIQGAAAAQKKWGPMKALNAGTTFVADGWRLLFSSIGGGLKNIGVPGGGAIQKFFEGSGADVQLNRRLAYAGLGGGTTAQVQADQKQALSSAEKMIAIEQKMVAIKTQRSSLTASDKDKLESTNEALKALREQYNEYLKQVSNARQNTQSQLTYSRQVLQGLYAERARDGITDEQKNRIDLAIAQTTKNIRDLESGQTRLDRAVSRLDTSLSTFTKILARTAERITNFRENLTNEFNDFRATLIKTGVSVGAGDQTIKLKVDQADFRELETWIRTLRQESQKLTEQIAGDYLKPQVDNLRKKAADEGVGFGTALFQRVANDQTSENKEAAQALLQLQDLKNQISQGELQLAQNIQQSKQTIRDLTIQINDFLHQLEIEIKTLFLDFKEQSLNLIQLGRRNQLQAAIIGGSKGLFGGIVSGVQGVLDQAGQLAQQYLGQERKKLDFEQKKYDLNTRMRDFTNSLGGATEELKKFIETLKGGTGGGSSSSGSGTASTGVPVLVGVTGDTGSSTAPHLDIRKKGGDRRLTAEELRRFQVNGKSLLKYRLTSEYGPRGGTMHRGVDFGIDVGGKITTTVPIKSVKLRKPEETGGGGYVSEVEFADGLVVQLLHLDPSTMRAGIGKSMGGSYGVGRIPRGGGVGSAERVMSDPAGAAAMAQVANRLKLPLEQFAALMSWESAGTLNPNVTGGDGGRYKGLIQFSPDNQRHYGTDKQQSIAQQMPAIEKYLLDLGFVPGKMDIRHAYSAILAGSVSEKYWDSADSNRTTVRNATSKFSQGDHYDRAVQFLRDSGIGSTPAQIQLPQGDAVAQAQTLSQNILNNQQALLGLGQMELGRQREALKIQMQTALEQIGTEIKEAMIQQGVSLSGLITGIDNTGGDSLKTAISQVEQTFIGHKEQIRTSLLTINNSLAEVNQQSASFQVIIDSLKDSKSPDDKALATFLQSALDQVKATVPELEKMKKQLEETEANLPQLKEREINYVKQKNELETKNAQIQVDLERAQTSRDFKLQAELAIQQEKNNLALQLLEIERDLSGRPEELAKRRAALKKQSDQKVLGIELTRDKNQLEEDQFQNDLRSRVQEAQAVRAEGLGGDNGIFGFRAAKLREENAILQENLRYRQEIIDLKIRYQDQPEILDELKRKASDLNNLNLQNIRSQFKGLGETITDVAQNALTQFFDDIFTNTKSAGDALRNLATTILKTFAQTAAKNLSTNIFGSLLGKGGLFGGIFKEGGTIPHYDDGGRVVPDPVSELLQQTVPGVKTGFIQEGSHAVLGVFTPGEEILSLRSGEAQRYQLLKKSLGSNPLKSMMAGNFAFGGTVGINPEILSGNFGGYSLSLSGANLMDLQGRSGQYGGGSVTINYEVKTPNADSFRRSQFQIDRDATLAAQKALSRK